MEPKINPEYEKLLPKLSKDEFEALKDSIKTEGQHYSIVVNEDMEVLDGHNRWKICRELGFEPDFEVRHFENKLLEKKFVIETNLRRRHLNDFQRAELGRPLLEIESELANLRQLAGVSIEVQDTLSSNELKVEKGQARDKVAKAIGVSPTTFQRATTIMDKAPEELKERVRKGKTSIAHAYSVVNTKERHREPMELPKGEFNVILADPPWEYDLQKRGSTLGHYETIALEKVFSLAVPSADNAILFLWATNPKLEDALQVMEHWGFKYKTNMVWVKNKFGTGYYFRGQHELLLVGVKGKIGVPEEQNRVSSVLNSPRREHSQKPEEIYSITETMYPNGKFLELYARTKRPKWEAWGNEL